MPTFLEWQAARPSVIKCDPLWRRKEYRIASFVAARAWPDVTRLSRLRETIFIAPQLYRALGSISANLSEGYSRGTPRDRARFVEIAIGSARESREWYELARPALDEQAVAEQIELLSESIRLMVYSLPQIRAMHSVRKEPPR